METGGAHKTKPFSMEGVVNGFRFKTMIDDGSPVTIFEVSVIKKILRKKHLQIRRMVGGEKYVDVNGKTHLTGLCVLPTRNGGQALVGELDIRH